DRFRGTAAADAVRRSHGREDADGAPLKHIPPDPRDAEVGRWHAELIVSAGLDIEQSDAIGPRTPGHAGAGPSRDCVALAVEAASPAVEEVRTFGTAAADAAEAENPRVLQEKIPLLRKEQVEARQVQLLIVGLDLREVGVAGEVRCEGTRHAVL